MIKTEIIDKPMLGSGLITQTYAVSLQQRVNIVNEALLKVLEEHGTQISSQGYVIEEYPQISSQGYVIVEYPQELLEGMSRSYELLIEETVPKVVPLHISEEEILTEMLEHDIIVRMPPKKRYTIELEVKNIRRGKPRIVEPEELQTMSLIESEET